MAQVTFIDAIAEVCGALDSVKEGQAKRMRLIVRRHDYGEERNYDEKGHRIHELYYYRMHDGPWSKGATCNREIIKAAQRAAHDIERDTELRPMWEAAHREHLAQPPSVGKKYPHFYNFVYVTILRDMYERAKGG